jgi:hypothetical protein
VFPELFGEPGVETWPFSGIVEVAEVENVSYPKGDSREVLLVVVERTPFAELSHRRHLKIRSQERTVGVGLSKVFRMRTLKQFWQVS